MIIMDRRRKLCVLILGGARSGKSRFAQKLADSISDRVLFVATAEALDVDMKARIKKHREERPLSWQTLEVSTNVADEIEKQALTSEVILIDCLTLLVSNLLLGSDRGFSDCAEVSEGEVEGRVTSEVDSLIHLMQNSKVTVIMVSNEVGLGLVPDNRLGRIYRDLLGRANQLVAQHADEVYFMVSGIPLKVKG